MDGLVLPDVPEVDAHGIRDRNLPEFRAQTPDQLHRILIGPVRCSKSRHRDRCDLSTFQSKQVKRAHCDKKRQCGIQPAGNAYDRVFAVCMLQTFL